MRLIDYIIFVNLIESIFQHHISIWNENYSNHIWKNSQTLYIDCPSPSDTILNAC